MKPIGIYVHHHSDGHRQRAIAIAKQAPDYFTLLGTGLKGKTGALSIVDLPDEGPLPTGQSDSPLHGAGHAAIMQRRATLIADWIKVAEPALLLVDASAEIAAVARMTATPTACVRLSGSKIDPAHMEAFRTAEAILCPFHKVLESEETPQWLRERSHYFPGLTNTVRNAQIAERKLLIVVGQGQNNIAPAQFLAVAQALPDWHIDVIGQQQPADTCAGNLHFHGWVNNPEYFIASSTVIAGAATDCLISAVAAAGRPFICMPQIRPFDEQYEKAARLEALRAAVICRKWPCNWPKTMAAALKRGAAMAALHDEYGAARAAELLLDTAYGVKRFYSSCYTDTAAKKLAFG